MRGSQPGTHTHTPVCETVAPGVPFCFPPSSRPGWGVKEGWVAVRSGVVISRVGKG